MRSGFTGGDYRTLTIVGTTRSSTISMGIPASYVTDGGFLAIFKAPRHKSSLSRPVERMRTTTKPSGGHPGREWVAKANSALSDISGREA